MNSEQPARTAVITGASKGIGRAVAAAFRAAGDRVVNLSRSPSPVAGVVNCQVDLASADAAAAIQRLARETLAKGRLALVHNAAVMHKDTAQSTSAASLREALELNLVAPQLLNRALLPLMAEGSAIIYIGSTLSEKAVAGAFSYVVSKHGLAGMMRATCQDLAGTGVHTACICPGITDTEMLRTHAGDDPATLAMLRGLSAFGRLIEPEEIADAVLFAADHPVMNGAVLHANLGQRES